MRLALPLLMLICAIFACNLFSPKLPSAEKPMASIEKVLRKDSPDTEITFQGMSQSKNFFAITFGFDKLTITKNGETKEIYDGKGGASFDYKDGKWILTVIQIREPEGFFYTPNLEVE